MKRILALALTMTSLLAIACGGGAPTAPSRAAVAAPPAAIAVAQSTPSAMFGASAVDFARCLQDASASGCFTGHRLTPRDAGSATAPDAPTGLTATADGSSVTLTWRAPTGNDPVYVYIIEAGSKPGAADLASFSTGNNVTTFSARGVGAGSYYVRVRASDRIVASAPSNEVLLVVGGGGGCTAAPDAPGGLFNSVSGNTLTLTWNAPSGGCAPSSYLLQAGSSAGLSDLANASAGAATTFVANSVGAGTYFVRVRALNAYGQSTASNEIIVTVGGAAPPPGGPSMTFVGLVSNGDGLVFPTDPSCGVEKADVQFVLSLAGNAVSGTVTNTFRVTPGGNQCDAPGKVQTGSISGTLSGSTLTFTLTDSHGQRAPGTATITSTRMVGSVSSTDNGQAFVVTFSANRQ